MSARTCTAETLLAHADAVEHSAAVGGYVDDRTGRRVQLDETRRRQWAASAAVLREAALEEVRSAEWEVRSA